MNKEIELHNTHKFQARNRDIKCKKREKMSKQKYIFEAKVEKEKKSGIDKIT